MQQQQVQERVSNVAKKPDSQVQDAAPLRESARNRNLVQKLDPKMSGFVSPKADKRLDGNARDLRVTNVMVNDKQMTLCWHFNCMKVNHRDSKRADDMIKWLCVKHEHLFEDGTGTTKMRRGKMRDFGLLPAQKGQSNACTERSKQRCSVVPKKLLMAAQSKTRAATVPLQNACLKLTRMP
jgi:hypothetical protein